MTPELKASIIILLRIKNQLNHAKDGMTYLLGVKGDEINGSRDGQTISYIDTSMFGLISYSFIWYAAFLDEYNLYFKSNDPTLNKRVSSIKSICKKYIDNVQKIFGDIKTARNRVLAHAYRDGNGKPLDNKQINAHFNQLVQFPSMSPYTQISNIVTLISEEIEKEFGEIGEDDISLIDRELEDFEEE
jgi:hypothetical protein